jgi:hypothetical protein
LLINEKDHLISYQNRNIKTVISEAAKEIRFIYYLLESIAVKIELPIVVRCDNAGAIFMAANLSSGVRTRHIDNKRIFKRIISKL